MFSLLAVVFILPVATAQAPSDPKKLAFEFVERNAAQIATVGDALYYFGEPGMQEHKSSKYLKQILEQLFQDKCVELEHRVNEWKA